MFEYFGKEVSAYDKYQLLECDFNIFIPTIFRRLRVNNYLFILFY